jgi:hypothetical protein
MADQSATAVDEIPFDEQVVETVADETTVDAETLTDSLVVLDAELRGHHSEFEDGGYVTVDGRRAYAVSETDWTTLLDAVDFEGDLAEALTQVHTRQARQLFASAVDGAPFDDEALGLVIGVETAEEMV